MGIVIMHYTGMAAMKMEPPILYDPTLFALSIVIAVLASTAGVWSAFHLRMESVRLALWKKVGSAFVVGCGIAGMHYTAMAAASFAPGSICTASPTAIEPTWLATTIAGFSLAFQATVLFISALYAYSADRVMRQSSRKLVEMQENERRDIARELHDRVGQPLTAMNININMIRTALEKHDEASIRSRTNDSLELIESVFKAVENVMYELRPPMIDQFGLVPSLKWYARTFAERTGTRVEVRGDEDLRFGSEVEMAFFRIAQEALNNVARHAQARNVVIELREMGPAIVLTIGDDGVGFDFAARWTEKADYGLTTMRERAEAVGGMFEAHSEKGKGTRIRVEVARGT
jgi:signal transduction histidine kinase